MKAAPFILLLLLGLGAGAMLVRRCTAQHHSTNAEPRWSVEVLRTTDARGFTYSSLHNATGEPQVTGSALRWTDEHGQRWIFQSGILAHEMKPRHPASQ